MPETRSHERGYVLRSQNAASLLTEAGRQILAVGLKAVPIGDSVARQGAHVTTFEHASTRAVLLC